MFRKITLVGASLALSLPWLVLAAPADEPPPPPPPPHLTSEQMQAIHDCMASKGVEMPPPPSGEENHPGDDARHHDGPPPMAMTEEQRQAMDACFAAAGVAPPQPRPEGDR